MIYTNRNLHKIVKKMTFGELTGFTIGEYGRGRKELFIPYEGGSDVLEVGANPNFSISFTKRGKPRINNWKNGAFCILTSSGGYTRRGNGNIYSLSSAPLRIIETANGADGAAGRIGYWVACIAELPPRETWIRIKRGGGHPSDFIHWDGKNPLFLPNSEIEHYIDSNGIEIPFEFEDRKFNSEEWDVV